MRAWYRTVSHRPLHSPRWNLLALDTIWLTLPRRLHGWVVKWNISVFKADRGKVRARVGQQAASETFQKRRNFVAASVKCVEKNAQTATFEQA